MAKKFFMRQTSMDKLLEQVQTLERKIDMLSQVAAPTRASDAPTAIYSVSEPTDSVDAVVEDDAPLYIPKARLGQASIKKVKTTVESHDSEDVEKLKRKRKTS